MVEGGSRERRRKEKCEGDFKTREGNSGTVGISTSKDYFVGRGIAFVYYLIKMVFDS